MNGVGKCWSIQSYLSISIPIKKEWERKKKRHSLSQNGETVRFHPAVAFYLWTFISLALRSYWWVLNWETFCSNESWHRNLICQIISVWNKGWGEVVVWWWGQLTYLSVDQICLTRALFWLDGKSTQCIYLHDRATVRTKMWFGLWS